MTRPTITHHVAVPSPCSSMPVHASVTLPRPPFALDLDGTRTATLPRSPPIRSDRTWRQDPVLRHADTRRDRG